MFRRIGRPHARRQLGWEAEETVAQFVGNPLIGRKNYALAERAFRVPAVRCPSLRLRWRRG